jgi:membrane protease YdiL (CAAX protease family)
MGLIKNAFRQHAGYMGRYPFTVALLAACCAVILFVCYQDKTLIHAVAYLFAVWFCCLLTDIVVLARPIEAVGFPIKRPVKNELVTMSICTVLGVAFLIIRFFTDWQHLPGMVKLSVLPLLLFMFPIVLALIYLFRYKYKLKELGVNLNYWYLPILLHIVWGAITLMLAREGSHWQEAYKEYGIFGSLFTGLISAALPEEFFRLLFMTRVGKASGSIAFGLFVATALWGAMHIPVGHGQSHEPVTLWRSVQTISFLMPIGVFWGYLTIRTKSLFSSVMMHGFNLWGLQNF